MHKLPKRLLFSATAALLALGLFEGALRLLDLPAPLPVARPTAALPASLRPDPGLGWAGAPHAPWPDPVYERWAEDRGTRVPHWDGFPTNSLGFRDTEPADPRPPTQVRVLALGDSSVAGSGAPRLQTFAERLERALAAPWTEDAAQRPVEVLNAGIPGYTSVQCLRTVEALLPLGLDVVLAYVMNSDLMMTTGPTDDLLYPRWRGRLAALFPRHLHLSELLRRALRPAPAPPAATPTTRVPLTLYRRHLEALVDLGAREGFSVIFILPTAPSDIVQMLNPRVYQLSTPAEAEAREASLASIPADRPDAFWRESYRQVMVLVGHRRGVPVVDAPQAMATAFHTLGVGAGDARALFADELHPTGEGHRIIAEATLPALRPQVEEARRRRGDAAD